MGPFAYILPPETAHIHCGATGLPFFRRPHIGVDKDSGLIHSVETTTTNVHDITRAAQLLHGEEEVVYSDAGY